ncbi:MAG: beta-galactosidase [Kiritimatiellia bacterium]
MKICLMGLLFLAPAAFGGACGVTFTEDASVFRNPGQGWSSMGGEASLKRLEKLVNVGAIYSRLIWAHLEPEEGVYNWKPLDDLLACGERHGLPVSFRIMCVNRSGGPEYDTPKWVFDKGAAEDPFEIGIHPWQRTGTAPLTALQKHAPHFDDPIFLEAHERFLRALGERYDGNPLLAGLDLGSYGNWGEWHCSGLPPNVPAKLDRDAEGKILDPQPKRKYVSPRQYPLELRKRYADIYLSVFRKTPIVFMSDDWEVMKYAMGDGSLPRVGFRRDGVGSPWHFKRWIGTAPYTALPNMGDVWKTQPIWLEFFGNAVKMRDKGWDVPYSIEWMLTNHVSVVNTCPFGPEQIKEDDPLRPLMRRIDLYAGARLVPQSASVTLEHDRLAISLTGVNKGVAPIHLPYEAVYTFKSADGTVVAEHISSADPTTWLPGPFALSDKLTPPPGFAEGRLTLTLRLRHTGGKLRDFRFAAQERDGADALIIRRN